jgi:multidrug efflux pump subunit AcrA (membrane-fusion protein)
VRDDTLASAEVKLGDRLGQRVEIREGLDAGATIVADNVDGLTPGVRVTPRKAKDQTPAKGGPAGGEGKRR